MDHSRKLFLRLSYFGSDHDFFSFSDCKVSNMATQNSLGAGTAGMTIAASHLCQIANIYGMLEFTFYRCSNLDCALLLMHDGMAGIAILWYDFPLGADM